jgi:putative sigma-54 modulation protein
MQLEFDGLHVAVTPAIRAHVKDQFKKLDHLFERSQTARAQVRIDVTKNRHFAEIVFFWRGYTLTAKDTNADMYQALTRCVEKLEKQALRLKKKLIDRSQSGVPLSALGVEPATGSAAAENPAPQPRIIPARRYRVKPMTPEEAAMGLSADGDQFVVFRDADTDRLSVLYKRKDGNFGLIQP